MIAVNEKCPMGYLIFKKVKIHNANSISSPLTYGFPAVTGFLGAFHAISRKLQADPELNNLSLGGVLLACHDCQPKIYRPTNYSNYTFNQSRNPIKEDGKPDSIIEEGKCDLTMTFVVEVLNDDDINREQQQALMNKTLQWIQQHRIAGGSVHGLDRFQPIQFISYEDIDSIPPLLIPAFVLMDAKNDFIEIIEQIQKETPEATALNALIDVCTIHHIPEEQENGEIKWLNQSVKKNRGWLVPMPIGYQSISEKFVPSLMENVRNPEYSSQYVEAIYGLGKWIFPYHLNNNDQLEHAFWRYNYDAENHLYLTNQENPYL